MLIAIGLLAVVLSYYVNHRRIVQARKAYEFALASFNSGTGMLSDVCQASRNLRDVQCHTFFRRRIKAGEAHLARMRELEAMAMVEAELGMWGNRDFPRRLRDTSKACREEAQQWLDMEADRP